MNRKHDKKNTQPLIIRIPKTLRDAFKATCAKRGKTMTETIRGFMQREAAKELPTK